MISIIHPSRGRVKKSLDTFINWRNKAANKTSFQWITSVDNDDSELVDYINGYGGILGNPCVRFHHNRSCVDAINNAVQYATGDIFMVVSDDFNCPLHWDELLLKQVEGREGWIMKTQDGIQDWIITLPILHRKYYEIDGYIYHPGFEHQFADTYMSCVADIRGRRIISQDRYEHEHYSRGFGKQDALHKRNDATWKQGEATFIRLMKEFTPEERSRIQDPGMKNWLRNKGVR